MKKHYLNLGSLKHDKKGVKLINQDGDVSWQLNIVLATFIRDSLKKFIKETPALPKTSNEPLNNLFNEHCAGKYTKEEYDKLCNELIEREDNLWKDKVNEVIASFDSYIHYYNDFYDSMAKRDDEHYQKMVDYGKKSFDLLKEIFDDLEW